MSHPFPTRQLNFHLTAATPCPYLEGRSERKVFTQLEGPDGPALVDALTHAGFRRSQSIVYRPACQHCAACLSARVVAADFTPSRTQRRVRKRNGDLIRAERAPAATDEQFALLSRYLAARHAEGGMIDMTFGDYAMMTADTPAHTRIVEYRDADDVLTAAALVDRLSDGFSLVYSFFEPEAEKRSLGVYVVLDHIAQAAAEGLPHVYLGYWVKGSPKMDYKSTFRPLEVLRPGGWRRLTDEEAAPSASAAAEDEPI